MERCAAEVCEAHLRLGRWLPLPLVVLLSLARGLLLGFLGAVTAAPAYVVVTHRDDGRMVGRLSAGRDPGVGEHLLAAVRDSMNETDPQGFMRLWHLDQA